MLHVLQLGWHTHAWLCWSWKQNQARHLNRAAAVPQSSPMTLTDAPFNTRNTEKGCYWTPPVSSDFSVCSLTAS
jgi:hypothetical protein